MRSIAVFVLALATLSAAVPVSAAQVPVGSFDSATNATCTIVGWAKDPDAVAALSVHVFKDAPFYQGGVFVGAVTANSKRTDLPYLDKAHGFSYVLPESSGLYDNQSHALYLYAIDATGDQNAALNPASRTITCAKRNNAQFVSQSVPQTMTAGETYPVTVSYKNIGTSTWTYPAYKIGSQDPSDNTTWNINRVWVPQGSTTPAGATRTFSFSVRAPATAGTYQFSWKMIEEMVEWFGEKSPVASVTVKAPITYADVVDYGATPNDALDDAPAIQRALDALAPTGGIVHIPAGTFMLGTSAGGLAEFPNGTAIQNAILIKKPNVTLRGEGSATVLMLMANTKMRAIGVDGTANTVIERLVVDGNKFNRDGSAAWPAADVVDALVSAFFTTDTIVRDCEVRNGLEDGLGFWQTNRSHVERCNSHHNGTSSLGGAGISMHAFDSEIKNSTIENNSSTGIWMAFGGQRITVKDSTIRGNSAAGITAGDWTDGAGNNRDYTITGNTITGNGSLGYPGIMVASAKNGTIANNAVSDNAYSGIMLSDDGVNPASTNWKITNNQCSKINSTQHWGMLIFARSQAEIRGNTCKNNGSMLYEQIIVQATATVNSDWQTENTLGYTQ